MKWIGLSGGLASGKSTVAALLRKKGYSVLDADQVAREVLVKGSPGLKKVGEVFGEELIGSDGELNRKKMAEVVFSSLVQLQKLEAIVHPLVQENIKKTRTQLKEKGENVAFYDVPLLFEKKMESQFDAIVLVTTSQDLQISRMKSRNQWSDEEIQSRLKSQWPLSEKEKRANYVIRNHGNLVELEKELNQVLLSLKQKLNLE